MPEHKMVGNVQDLSVVGSILAVSDQKENTLVEGEN
jgi:hypothetical protein